MDMKIYFLKTSLTNFASITMNMTQKTGALDFKWIFLFNEHLMHSLKTTLTHPCGFAFCYKSAKKSDTEELDRLLPCLFLFDSVN